MAEEEIGMFVEARESLKQCMLGSRRTRINVKLDIVVSWQDIVAVLRPVELVGRKRPLIGIVEQGSLVGKDRLEALASELGAAQAVVEPHQDLEEQVVGHLVQRVVERHQVLGQPVVHPFVSDLLGTLVVTLAILVSHPFVLRLEFVVDLDVSQV